MSDNPNKDKVISDIVREIAVAVGVPTTEVKQIVDHNYKVIKGKIADSNDDDIIKIPYFGKILMKKRIKKNETD